MIYAFASLQLPLRELVWRWAALLVKLCDNAKAKKWLTGFVYNFHPPFRTNFKWIV